MAAVFDRQMSPPGLPEPGAPSRVSSAGGNGTGLSEDTNNIKATIIQDIWIHLDSGSHMAIQNSLADWCTTAFHTKSRTYWSLSSATVKVKVPFIGRCMCETKCHLHNFSGTSMKALGTPYFVVQSGFLQPFSNPKDGGKEFWIDMFFSCMIFRAVLKVLSLDGFRCCLLLPLAVSLRPGRARKASTSQARNWTKGSCRVETRPYLDVCGSACKKKAMEPIQLGGHESVRGITRESSYRHIKHI